MISGGFLFVEDTKQPILYFILPKSNNDILNINLPEIVLERINDWIIKEVSDIFIDGINKKYTFIDAKVNRQVIQNNRYGMPSRDLYISYKSMIYGLHRRK